MAGQLALLFARRLRCRSCSPTSTRPGVDKGVGVRARRDRQAARARAGPPGRGQPAHGAGHRLARPRTRFADADFVIEAVFEELEVKQQVFAEVEAVVSARSACWPPTPRRCRSPRWRPSWPTRSGWSASTSSTRSRCCRCWRSSAAERPTTRRWPPRSRSARQLKKSCVLVKDAPAFVVNRLLTRFLGEVIAAVDEGTPVEVADRALDAARPADAPFVLLAAGRPGGRAARRRDAARGVPGPVRASATTSAGWSRRASRALLSWTAGRAGGRPGGRGAVRGRRPAVRPRSRCASGRWPRWPRRCGSCSTRAWWPSRRTSTCACSSAPAGRSTSAASRRTWTGPASPSGSPAAGSSRRAWPACP